MDGFDRIKMRAERMKKMIDDSLSPERAWETVHPHHSPPKKYPTPNFLTNPYPTNEDMDEEDDFYDYLSDEDQKEDKRKPSKEDRKEIRRQHDIDDEEHMARIRELEKKKKLDEIRDKVNQDAHHNLLVHQINQTRTVDPFAKSSEPLLLQLYLRIYGGFYLNPRPIALVQSADAKMSEMNVFRNTYVQYKDFPKGRKQKTVTMMSSNSPVFNYKAYFPFVVGDQLMTQLSKFFFLFEVWDQVTPDQSH